MNTPSDKQKSIPPMQVEAPARPFWVLLAIGTLIVVAGVVACLRR